MNLSGTLRHWVPLPLVFGHNDYKTLMSLFPLCGPTGFHYKHFTLIFIFITIIDLIVLPFLPCLSFLPFRTLRTWRWGNPILKFVMNFTLESFIVPNAFKNPDTKKLNENAWSVSIPFKTHKLITYFFAAIVGGPDIIWSDISICTI